MKTTKHKNSTGYISFVILLLSLAFMLPSCARKISFMTSDVVPAAEGRVKIKKDKNSNHKIELNVTRLADPKRLTPSKDLYIVWMETDEQGTKNIGRLKTSSGLFSNKLKSALTTVTTLKPVRIYITAEDYADVQYPAGQVVLSTGSF